MLINDKPGFSCFLDFFFGELGPEEKPTLPSSYFPIAHESLLEVCPGAEREAIHYYDYFPG